MNRFLYQLLACHEKGGNAFKAGAKREDCPYKGHRGFNRQRADYWRQGWDEQFNIALDQRLFDRARAGALKTKEP